MCQSEDQIFKDFDLATCSISSCIVTLPETGLENRRRVLEGASAAVEAHPARRASRAVGVAPRGAATAWCTDLEGVKVFALALCCLMPDENVVCMVRMERIETGERQLGRPQLAARLAHPVGSM